MKKLNFKYFLTAVYFPIYLVSFFFIERFLYLKNYHLISTSIDHQIPFIPQFIYFYYLWFPFMAYSLLRFFFTYKKDYLKLYTSLVIGMSLFVLVSIIYPNQLDIRPNLKVTSLSTYLVSLIYKADTPTNVLPSIHIYNSIAIMISILLSFKTFKFEKIGAIVLTIGICLSTIFVKQHGLIDVVSACLLNIIVYFIVYHFNIYFFKKDVEDYENSGCI